MAFVDSLMQETDASVIMVDRHDRPGGHWNDSYPFVRLHQPSAFYGVNSRALGDDNIDTAGWNKGLYELASGTEVVTYFEQVMQRQFLPSGRVQYFPMSEYRAEAGKHLVVSTVTGVRQEVTARKVVDASYMNVLVPSVRGPLYDVADGVRCVPLNALPREQHTDTEYVIVGAGKTAMDAVLWLLRNAVDPDQIRWIMPRDSWILDRAFIQPGALAANTAAGFMRQGLAIANAETVEQLFDLMEEAGQLLRLDETIRPTMYRCATVTQAELEQLRRVKNVIRKGRVERIEAQRIVLQDGEEPTGPNVLHVDCSADGLARREPVDVFRGDTITLQSVRTCQQVFSAAFIGHVEAAYGDGAEENQLCTPVPHPNSDIDFLRTSLAAQINAQAWAQDTALTQWLMDARLDGFSQMGGDASAVSSEARAQVDAAASAAEAKLRALLAQVDAAP